MKSYYRHILLTSAVLLAAAACTKTVPEGPQVTDMQINICASESLTKSSLNNGTFNPTGTKSLLDANTFAAEGNRIQIYDFVTSGGATTKHVDDLIGPELNSNSPLHTPGYTWPFVNGPHQWCPGEHKFFGWLAQDANMTASNTPEAFFGSGFGFDEATHVLTIPQVTFTKDTPQFDFMYSDIFTTEPINAPVQLNFSHLFCAVSFGISNGDTQDIEIKSLNVSTYNSMSATIDFTGEDTHVTYTKSSTSTGVFRSLSNAYTLQGGGNCDNAFNSTSSGKDFRLLWPMTSDELKDCRITVTYLYKSDNAQYTKELAFPDPAAAGLLAGNKYHYSIGLPSLKTTQVTIKCEVCPWDTANTDITFN